MAGPDGYAGVMLSVKVPYLWRYSANSDSVRDRGTECTVHGAENSRRREVAKPGIALGSGPRDRGFEFRPPDHLFVGARRTFDVVSSGVLGFDIPQPQGVFRDLRHV